MSRAASPFPLKAAPVDYVPKFLSVGGIEFEQPEGWSKAECLRQIHLELPTVKAQSVFVPSTAIERYYKVHPDVMSQALGVRVRSSYKDEACEDFGWIPNSGLPTRKKVYRWSLPPKTVDSEAVEEDSSEEEVEDVADENVKKRPAVVAKRAVRNVKQRPAASGR